MSYESENEDVTTGVAAELTGSLGVPEDATSDDVLPNDLADAVEEQERHLAERDIPVNNDVDDTREAAEQREAEQGQQRGKKVPLAALQEERTRRQALEQQLQAQAQQMQQWQAQIQAAQQAQQAQQEAAIPAFEDDPQGHIEAVKQQFKQELENLKNGQGQQQQFAQVQQQLHQEMTALAPAVAEAEARFAEANPDYRQAFEHVQSVVEQNMRAQHPGATEEQLLLIRNATLVQYAKQCQAQGIDPAEHLYGRAQQLGFKAATRAPRREPLTSITTLSGVSRPPDERSSVRVSDIAEMTEKEFDDFWSSMRRSSTIRPAY